MSSRDVPPGPPSKPVSSMQMFAYLMIGSGLGLFTAVTRGWIDDPLEKLEFDRQRSEIVNEGAVAKMTQYVFFDIAIDNIYKTEKDDGTTGDNGTPGDNGPSKSDTETGEPSTAEPSKSDVTFPKVYRVVLGLYGEECPKTTKNFLTFTTTGYTSTLKRSSTGTSKNKRRNSKNSDSSKLEPKKIFHYRDSPFHRIIPGFMIQGGDVSRGDGTGSVSSYGYPFDDESFAIDHSPFCLSMANRGLNSNGSQFFITVDESDHLDGKHVVFGHVIGSESTENVRLLSTYGDVYGTGNVKSGFRVYVKNCGIIGNDEGKSLEKETLEAAALHELQEEEKEKEMEMKWKKQREKIVQGKEENNVE